MKKFLSIFLLALLPVVLKAQVTQQLYQYTDASGNLIPFLFGKGQNNVYTLTFPLTINSTLQAEVLALPQFNNYSISGAAPTVSQQNLFPPGSANPYISSDIAKSASFTVAASNLGTIFQVTTGSSTIVATFPTAATVGDGFYFFIRKADAGTGLITNSALTDSVTINGHMTQYWTDGTNWYARAWYGAFDVTGNLTISAPGNVNLGNGPLATTATAGFVTIPSGAGTPTGTPTAVTGHVPLYYDSTNAILYAYANATWNQVGASFPISIANGGTGSTTVAAAAVALTPVAVNLGNLTGTVNINWASGTHFYGTLTANTIFTFSNAYSGGTIVVRVYQTGTNAFTVTWPTISWRGGSAPTMTTGTAAHDTTTIDYQNSTYDGSSLQNITP
jgi:hypothetical protein